MNEAFSLIKIPDELFKKIEKRIQDTEFKSTEEYIIFVMEEVLKETDDDFEDDSEETFSEEDEKKIKERLKSLGYLD